MIYFWQGPKNTPLYYFLTLTAQNPYENGILFGSHIPFHGPNKILFSFHFLSLELQFKSTKEIQSSNMLCLSFFKAQDLAFVSKATKN